MLFFGTAPGQPGVSYDTYIGSIAAGDKAALGALYEAIKSAVYGFALSIVRNAQDAEDILQDTFVHLYTSASSYKSMGKPMAWVLAITRNLCLMKIRGRQKTADIPEEEWALFPSGTEAANDDKLVLTAALKTIGREEGQIVMLHAVAGLKHREIARMLELPLSTVLSKYNRALKKLKSILEEAGGYAEQRG